MVSVEEIKEKETELRELRLKRVADKKAEKTARSKEFEDYRNRLKEEKLVVDEVLAQAYVWKKLGIRAKSQMNIKEKLQLLLKTDNE